MIAALLHQVPNVLLPPVVEEEVVSVLDLRQLPRVERLGHHHDSEFVADLQLLLARHVVRGAKRIAAHFLEERHLPAKRVLVKRRAQGPEIVVEAHALELARGAVQQELAVPVLERPHTEAFLLAVGERPVLRIDLGDQRVEPRILRRPRLEVARQRAGLGRGDLAIAKQDAMRDPSDFAAALGLDLDRLQVRRPDCAAPCLHADGIAEDELHGTDDARARIPARAFGTVFRLDENLMLAGLRRQLDLEGVVAALPFADLDAVAENLRLAHHAVEDERRVARPGRNRHRTAVLALADERQGAGATGFLARLLLPVLDDGDDLLVDLLVEGTGNRPVMRHRHALPHAARAAELPSIGQLDHLRSLRRNRRDHRRQHHRLLDSHRNRLYQKRKRRGFPRRPLSDKRRDAASPLRITS